MSSLDRPASSPPDEGEPQSRCKSLRSPSTSKDCRGESEPEISSSAVTFDATSDQVVKEEEQQQRKTSLRCYDNDKGKEPTQEPSPSSIVPHRDDDRIQSNEQTDKEDDEADGGKGDAEDDSGNDEPGKEVARNSLKSLFTPWTSKPPHPPGEPHVPQFNENWGWTVTTPRPYEAPLDFSNQPAARESEGQTVPPLWENREFACKRGTRKIKIDGLEVDQQDHLVLRLIDMRSRIQGSQGGPKRAPRHVAYLHGTPKDWNQEYTMRKLNQSRHDYIKRICGDKLWTNMEARFLAEQFRINRNISIMELACRLNDRFVGKTYIDDPKDWDSPSRGRTIECVRAEYLAYKDQYDQAVAPHKKTERDRNEIVERTGLTVGAMMDGDAATNEAPVDVPMKNKQPTYAQMTVKDLRKHAGQRIPKVSLGNAPLKPEIIKRLKDADKYGVDKKGMPKWPTNSEGGMLSVGVSKSPAAKLKAKAPGVLSIGVVHALFRDTHSGAVDYKLQIVKLMRARAEAVKRGLIEDAEELQNLITSIEAADVTTMSAVIEAAFAAESLAGSRIDDSTDLSTKELQDTTLYISCNVEEDKEVFDSQTKESSEEDSSLVSGPKQPSMSANGESSSLRKRSRSGSAYSALPISPTKRCKTSASSYTEFTGSSRSPTTLPMGPISPKSGSIKPHSRTTSKVKIDEEANTVIEASTDEDAQLMAISPTTPNRKPSNTPRRTSAPKPPGRRPSTRSEDPSRAENSTVVSEEPKDLVSA